MVKLQCSKTRASCFVSLPIVHSVSVYDGQDIAVHTAGSRYFEKNCRARFELNQTVHGPRLGHVSRASRRRRRLEFGAGH